MRFFRKGRIYDARLRGHLLKTLEVQLNCHGPGCSKITYERGLMSVKSNLDKFSVSAT